MILKELIYPVDMLIKTNRPVVLKGLPNVERYYSEQLNRSTFHVRAPAEMLPPVSYQVELRLNLFPIKSTVTDNTRLVLAEKKSVSSRLRYS